MAASESKFISLESLTEAQPGENNRTSYPFHKTAQQVITHSTADWLLL